jgi:hypothetical protein
MPKATALGAYSLLNSGGYTLAAWLPGVWTQSGVFVTIFARLQAEHPHPA